MAGWQSRRGVAWSWRRIRLQPEDTLSNTPEIGRLQTTGPILAFPVLEVKVGQSTAVPIDFHVLLDCFLSGVIVRKMLGAIKSPTFDLIFSPSFYLNWSKNT